MSIVAGTHLAGRYEILSPLGAGGMGEVYKARDLRLGRDVAVKVLSAHLAADSNALSRFEREGKAVAALSHPNILAIHDFGNDNGVSFAVMELLEGETLRDRIKSSPLPWRNAVELAVPIAEGLSAAHSKGVIHRDLKPENIFLTSEGQVKILDFGLAYYKMKTLEQELSSAPTDSQISQTGSVMGTVPYMSPEQIRGTSVDARSDLFAFGSVLCEMLTGTRAFGRTTAADTMAAILKEEPNEIDPLWGKIPVELQRVITHCLEKNPEQRFQTARDLAFDLKATLSGSTLVLHEKRRRLRGLWAIPVLLLLGLISTSVYLLQGRGTPIRSLAVMPFVNGSENPDAEYLSDGISESIVSSLSHVPKLRVLARDTVFIYKGQNDPRKIGRDLKVDAVVMGRLVQHGDTLVIRAHLINVSDGSELWGNQYNRKLADVLAIQEEISREISNNLKLKLTEPEQKLIAKHYTENTEAYQLYLRGRYHWYKFTPEDYQKGLEYYQQAIDKDPSYALAYSGLAHSYVSMSVEGLIPPKEGCQKAQWAARKAMEMDSKLAEAHYALGATHACELNWRGAIEGYQRAVEINPNYVEARRFLSLEFRSLGRWEEAIHQSKKAQELDPLSVETNKWLAGTYYWAGLYDKAIEQLHKTLELDPNHATTHDLLADVYARKGMHQEAIQEEIKYLSLVSDEEGVETLRNDYQSYGYHEARKRQHQRVLELYQEIEKEQYVSPIVFATIFTQLGEADQAFVWLEKAYQERSPWLGFIKTDPQFEPLRSDPRFNDLLKRLGLT